jgi:hypothetical protein
LGSEGRVSKFLIYFVIGGMSIFAFIKIKPPYSLPFIPVAVVSMMLGYIKSLEWAFRNWRHDDLHNRKDSHDRF